MQLGMKEALNEIKDMFSSGFGIDEIVREIYANINSALTVEDSAKNL